MPHSLEIQMEIFRMMKSGSYIGRSGAKQLLADIKTLFPEVPTADLTNAVLELTQRPLKEPA